MKISNKYTAFAVILVILTVFPGCIGQEEEAVTRILRVTYAWPTYIDPAVGNDYSSTSSIVNLYDSLVYPTLEGTVMPHIAETWDASADGLTWTFNLRKGVKFHDGSELMAEDVAYTMDRLTTIGEGYSFLFTPYMESTTVLDDYTVQFKLHKSFGPFLGAMVRLYILNKDLVMENTAAEGPYGDNGDYGKDWLLTHDAGSGAYKVKEFRLEEELIMERFDDYWGEVKPNAPEQVHFIGTTEAVTIRTGISNREIEIADQWQTEEALAVLGAMEGVDIALIQGGGTFYYMIHTRKPPTDCVHFRKAMAWAMDYQEVIDEIYLDSLPASGPVADILPGSNHDVLQYTRDLDKAMAELQQSKYYDTLDDYEVEVGWVTEVPAEEKVALLFADCMADIGIKVKVVNTPWLTMVENTASQEMSPHIATIFVAPSFPEAGDVLQMRYHSSNAASWMQNEWLLNETLDAMIEDALVTVDTEERFVKYRKIEAIIVDMCPSLYIFETISKQAYQSYYVDWPASDKAKQYVVMGYNVDVRFFEVYPEKREELLGE